MKASKVEKNDDTLDTPFTLCKGLHIAKCICNSIADADSVLSLQLLDLLTRHGIPHEFVVIDPWPCK